MIMVLSCLLHWLAIPAWLDAMEHNRQERIAQVWGVLRLIPILKRIQQRLSSQAQDICVICRDKLHNGRAIIMLPCDHRLHMTCLGQWHTTNKKRQNCILCRRGIDYHDAKFLQDAPKNGLVLTRTPLLKGLCFCTFICALLLRDCDKQRLWAFMGVQAQGALVSVENAYTALPPGYATKIVLLICYGCLVGS